MKKRVERLRGMHDLLPEAQLQQHWLRERVRTFLGQAGYAQVDTPVLERSDLFQASFGQELWQNLYAFRLHHRDLCLRPEYTASICRLYRDSYQQQPLPLRFQYAGPVFRYESPGRSRYRQHTQLGIELFGGHPWAADAEILQLACGTLHDLHIADYRLELGHIGVASGFVKKLELDEQAARLLLSLMEQISRSEDGERHAQERLEALYPRVTSQEDISSPTNNRGAVDSYHIAALLNGISISFGDEDARSEVVDRFLWKMGRSEQRRQILYALDFLKALHTVSGSPPHVFDALRELLARYELDAEPLVELQQLVAVVEQSGISDEQIVLNLSLGRGVSYYTGLVFEIHAQDEDGFDAQLCGGGRYDRLMHAVGGSREVNACGFALGLERLHARIPKQDWPTLPMTEVLVVPVRPQELPYALHIARLVRQSGMQTEVDITGNGVGAGLKQAARKQIELTLIVGENEQRENVVTLHNIRTGEEQVLHIEALLEQVAQRGQVL